MIPLVDRPEIEHLSDPILRIDMTEMDRESIQTMLENSRDGFYSNKELAPIREYSTNARDAHIQAGIGDRPFHITLPTKLNPVLKIRDFGAGLSLKEISDVYFKYWKSTKRGTNEQNGCLGIGSKSAFAYTDCYTVTTWSEGMKTICTGQKNGFADVIARIPKPANEPDGVEVSIPIAQKDIDKFVHEALEFFKYWNKDIRPVFHGVEPSVLKEAFHLLDTEPFLKGNGWSVRPSGYGKGCSRAVMGFVPYPIDWDQVQNSLSLEVKMKVGGIFSFLEENITTIEFPNGSLAFTPNREALQYNEPTVKALTEKLIEIYNALITIIGDKISGAANLWDAKIAYNRIFRKELEGFDKGFAYGGNLSTLEHLLRGRIEWKGIIIENGYFDNLEKWDVNKGQQNANTYDRSEMTPVFTTFQNNGGEIRQIKVKRWGSGKLICSPKNVVIIQDTDSPTLAKAFAKWFLNASGLDIKNVYVLDLHVKATKDAFFKYYNFDTVPVHYVSANLAKIQAYRKSCRGNGTSGSNGVSRPLYCPFIKISEMAFNSRNWRHSPNWEYETVNARGIEGGVYVRYSRKNITVNGQTIEHDRSEDFWNNVYNIIQRLGLHLEKVYGIHPKTADSSWFKKAVAKGNWISLEDYIRTNLEIIPKEETKKACAYESVESYFRIGTVVADALYSQITNTNSPLYQFCRMVVTEVSPNRGYVALIEKLGLKEWAASEKDIKAMRDTMMELRKRYPLIARHHNNDAIKSCDPKGYYNKLSKEELSEIVDYVNLVDLHLSHGVRRCA